MALIKCPECGGVITDNQNVCLNCGYKISKNRKKWIIMIVGAVAVIVMFFFVNYMMNVNKYECEMSAYKQLCLEMGGGVTITKMYFSDEVAEGSTIDYIYRVYIVYKREAEYEEECLYILDDKGIEYFVTDDDSNNERLYCYKALAEVEIFGLEGWLEPSGKWESRSRGEIQKIVSKTN